MKFVKGMVIGSIVSAGIIMLCNENMNVNKKRIIRILEIYHATGYNKTEQERKSREKEPEFDYKVYGLNMPREKLYKRIDLRVDIMIKQGLIEEVEKIYKKYWNNIKS